MAPMLGWLAAAGMLVCTVLANDLLSGFKAESNAPVSLTVNSFKMCPDHLDVPSTYDNLSLWMDPEFEHTIFVDGVLNMKEEVPEGALLIVDIRRCYDNRDVSCEKYIIQEVEDICSYLPEEDKIWSEFVKHIQGMEPKCPIPAGSYIMDEAPVDLSSFQGKLNGHWQLELSFSHSGKLYGCALMDVTIGLRKDVGEI